MIWEGDDDIFRYDHDILRNDDVFSGGRLIVLYDSRHGVGASNFYIALSSLLAIISLPLEAKTVLNSSF